MKLLIQNSLTGTLINLEIDETKRVSDILERLVERGDISTSENKAIVYTANPLPEYITIEAIKKQYDFKSNDLLVLIERKSQGGRQAKAQILKRGKPTLEDSPVVKSEEESLFNELMNMPTSTNKITRKTSQTSSRMEKEQVKEDPNLLFEQFSQEISIKASKLLPLENLRKFLMDSLGDSFDRIRGAWNQLENRSIRMNDLIRAGIFILGRDFINPFLLETQEPSVFPSSQEEANIVRKEEFSPPSLPPQPLEHEIRITESEGASDANITIPGVFLDEIGGKGVGESSIKVEPVRPSPPQIGIIKKKPLKIEGFGGAPKTVKAPKKLDQRINAFVKPSEVIESVAPKKQKRSSMDAVKHVGSELKKIEVERMKFDLIDESEISSVDVGAILPGSEFEEIRKLIYDRFYEEAENKLKKLMGIAKNNNDHNTLIRAEDLLTNLNVYEMIPVLIDAGDKELEDLAQAKRKYEKARDFAKTINDEYYVRKLDRRLSKIDQRVDYTQRKKKAIADQRDKLRELVIDHVKALSRENTLMSIEDIKKYCQINKEEEYFVNIIVEMIEKKDIYAKFFPSSNKVMFDKDSNREFVMIDKSKLRKY